MTDQLAHTASTDVRRRERASYDRAAVYAVLDDAVVAHVAFVDGAQPFAIPMVFGRVDDTLYLHGALGARILRRLGEGAPVCVTVTQVDALVLAKAQVHHSANYRCVVLLGAMRRVAGAEAERALAAIVDHALPGRSGEARPPNASELRRTGVLALRIDEGSLKVRGHGPVDDEADTGLDVWSGLMPITTIAGAAVADPLSAEMPVPRSVLRAQARVNGARTNTQT